MTRAKRASNFSGVKGWLTVPQLTLSAVRASLTMNLSLGERPVRLPVSATSAPLEASCPSPFCREISTKREGLRFLRVLGRSIKVCKLLCIFSTLLYMWPNSLFYMLRRQLSGCKGWLNLDLQGVEVGEQVAHLAVCKDAFEAGHVVAASVDGLLHDVVIGGTPAGQKRLAKDTSKAGTRERFWGVRKVAVAAGLGVEALAALFGFSE